MTEEFRENFSKKNNNDKKEVKEFDRKAEKNYRKEVRKILSEKMSEVLGNSGFKKTGYSLWSRKVGDSWHIVYLQRSQFSHQYFIEAGICNEKDIPKGKKLDIVFCKGRERIEGIVSDMEKEENVEELAEKKVRDINAALNFEAPDAQKKYPEEYFVPSVNFEEAENKIEKIQKVVGQYVPLWFKKFD